MAFKNTAVTKVIIAWDTVNNVYKTGDSANITTRGVGDGSEFTPAAPSITEIDSTNLPGRYSVALAAGENNYHTVALGGKSSTSGIAIFGPQWDNEMNANLVQILATALTETVGGYLAAAFKKVFDVTTPVFTAASVNQTENNATRLTDLQSRVPAALTGNGNMKSSLVEILTTALTETAGQLAGGFKKFFNIATPAATMDHGVLVDTVTTVTNQLTAAQIATGIWQDTTAGDFTTALSVGKSLMNGVALGTGLKIAECVLVDTVTTNTDMLTQANVRTAVGLASANLDTQLGNIRTDTNTTIPALIAALNNISTAQVKAQVVAALSTDTYAEPGQGTPAATTDLRTKIGMIYKATINKSDQTALLYQLYNGAGAVVDQKAAVADDGTTFSRDGLTTGP